MSEIFEIPSDEVLEFNENNGNNIEKKLSKTSGTYHNWFKLIKDEYRRKKKKLKIWTILVRVVLIFVIIIDSFFVKISSWIFFICLYGLIIIYTEKNNNENNKLNKIAYILENHLKRKEYKEVGDDDVLFKYYYEFDDINSEEARKYAEKHEILGTYRSKKKSKK